MNGGKSTCLSLFYFPYLATHAPIKRLLKIGEIKPDTFQVTYPVSLIFWGVGKGIFSTLESALDQPATRDVAIS